MASFLVHFLNLLGSAIPAKFFFLKNVVYRLSGISVGQNSRLGFGIFLNFRNVELGNNVWVGPWCRFYSTPQARIIISDNVDIGPEVSFITGTHSVGSSKRRAGEGLSTSIVIGCGSWIGARACLLGGADIGVGSIVAAGSVVTPGKYPPNVLLAGVPAKIKKCLSQE